MSAYVGIRLDDLAPPAEPEPACDVCWGEGVDPSDPGEPCPARCVRPRGKADPTVERQELHRG